MGALSQREVGELKYSQVHTAMKGEVNLEMACHGDHGKLWTHMLPD